MTVEEYQQSGRRDERKDGEEGCVYVCVCVGG